MICVGVRVSATAATLKPAVLQESPTLLIDLLLDSGWSVDRFSNFKLSHPGSPLHKLKNLCRGVDPLQRAFGGYGN